MAVSQIYQEKMYRAYMEFFEIAERKRRWHLEDSIPAFLTVILIPLTFSITQGILWGFISHVALYLLAGRFREIHPLMYVLGLIAIGLVWLEHGKF